jgi:hypothetical protein
VFLYWEYPAKTQGNPEKRNEEIKSRPVQIAGIKKRERKGFFSVSGKSRAKKPV